MSFSSVSFTHLVALGWRLTCPIDAFPWLVWKQLFLKKSCFRPFQKIGAKDALLKHSLDTSSSMLDFWSAFAHLRQPRSRSSSSHRFACPFVTSVEPSATTAAAYALHFQSCQFSHRLGLGSWMPTSCPGTLWLEPSWHGQLTS